jgi:hypothetical protein
MTPKEKAKELMEKFENLEPLADTELDERFQKEAALLVVYAVMQYCTNDEWFYWDEVKNELEAI